MATLKQNKITIHYTMEDNQTKKFLQTEILHGKHQYTKILIEKLLEIPNLHYAHKKPKLEYAK